MSLDFNLNDVKLYLGPNFEPLTRHPEDPERWHPVVEAVVFGCMHIGLGEITEKSIDEWWRRYAMFQEVAGPPLRSRQGEIYLTRADVEKFVGLTTNVSAMGKREFKEKLMRIIEANAERGPGQDGSAYDVIARHREAA